MSYPNLNGVVQSAPNKSLGFNVDSKILGDNPNKFVKLGYKFCLRYVSLGENEDQQRDLTREEASGILEAGLALMPVQHVRYPGWRPSAELGKRYGENAAAHAAQIGFPTEVNLWCDLEGIHNNTHGDPDPVTLQEIIDYCNAWYDSVCYRGYLPGLYVGANTHLNQEELYQDLKFKHYWKSDSSVPDVHPRGYQMIQHLQSDSETVKGFQINKDITYIDNYGGRPQWLINPKFV